MANVQLKFPHILYIMYGNDQEDCNEEDDDCDFKAQKGG
ncbi:replication protein RepB [Prevotella intermedia ZT]|uniref:Replication protein RepB n=1 Tax=Prevotella intermedia ZT TaxID=1347790 RepID=A0AAP0VDU7_PREIN|nr:replication protein RepB [Prevotella intermedia ZT]